MWIGQNLLKRMQISLQKPLWVCTAWETLGFLKIRKVTAKGPKYVSWIKSVSLKASLANCYYSPKGMTHSYHLSLQQWNICLSGYLNVPFTHTVGCNYFAKENFSPLVFLPKHTNFPFVTLLYAMRRWWRCSGSTVTGFSYHRRFWITMSCYQSDSLTQNNV